MNFKFEKDIIEKAMPRAIAKMSKEQLMRYIAAMTVDESKRADNLWLARYQLGRLNGFTSEKSEVAIRGKIYEVKVDFVDEVEKEVVDWKASYEKLSIITGGKEALVMKSSKTCGCAKSSTKLGGKAVKSRFSSR